MYTVPIFRLSASFAFAMLTAYKFSALFTSLVHVHGLFESLELSQIFSVLLSTLSIVFAIPRLSALSAFVMFMPGLFKLLLILLVLLFILSVASAISRLSASLASTMPVLLYAYLYLFSCYWYIYLLFYCKSQQRVFESIKQINLYIIISTSLVISFSIVISEVITPKTFMKYTNRVLVTSGLTTDSYITINGAFIVWIYDQHFIFWLDI